MEIGIWVLPFDLARGGELVEPFVICHLVLVFFYIQRLNIYLGTLFNYIKLLVGDNAREKGTVVGNTAKIQWPPPGDNRGPVDNAGTG